MKKILVYKSQEELISAAAEYFISIGQRANRERGKFSVALSGGSTPEPLYVQLAAQQGLALEWDKVHFFWGDERSVPPDQPDSNFNQANQSLLIPRAIQDGAIHRIPAELPAADAARLYQDEILGFFQEKLPRFDLILLGMGADGHTASLFPETGALTSSRGDHDWLVTANWVPKLDTWRITFTPQLINAARNVLVLVSGQNKAAALKQVLEGIPAPQKYPSQLINPDQGDLLWLVDQDAAAALHGADPGYNKF